MYTDIAELVEIDDGYLVFFAGERRPLDSSQVGSSLNNLETWVYRLTTDVFTVSNPGSDRTH